MKALSATCENKVVTADGVSVPAAEILSEGVGASSGVLIIDEDRAKYIADTTPDLKVALEKIIAALGQVSSALSTLAGKSYLTAATGGVPDPTASTSWASNISELDNLASELTTLKGALK